MTETTTTRETRLNERKREEDFSTGEYIWSRLWLIETLDENGNVIETRRKWRVVK